MEPQGLLELGQLHPKEEWRSVVTTDGALSVMTHGIVWMPELFAFSLATVQKVCM